MTSRPFVCRGSSSDYSFQGAKFIPSASGLFIWSRSKLIAVLLSPAHRETYTWPQLLVNALHVPWCNTSGSAQVSTKSTRNNNISHEARGLGKPHSKYSLSNLIHPASDLWLACISFLHTQHMVSWKDKCWSLLCITRFAGCRRSVYFEHCLFKLLVYILLFKSPNLFLLLRYAQICEQIKNVQKQKQKKSIPQYS